MYSKTQYISQGATPEAHLYNIRAVLDAGYRWIQLRYKNGTEQELIRLAAQVRQYCSSYGAIYIVNDYVGVAKAVDADGVHLGRDDLSPLTARELLGPEKIIGGTANTLQDLVQRIHEGCSYIGLGPFRFTQTKEKLSPVLGLEAYRQIISALDPVQQKIPVYAVGGITATDIPALLGTGIYGIAVSGMLTPHKAMRKNI